MKKIRDNSLIKNEKQVLSIVVVVMLLVAICVIVYATCMIYFSDKRKIDAKRNEITQLQEELKDANIRFNELQNQYDQLAEQLKQLEISKAKEIHKRSQYEPIIKSALKYIDSDLNYLNAAFVETVFTLSASKNVNPYIIFAIVDVESNFNSKARNKSGAIGLGQIMPTTGEYIHKVLMKRSDKYSHETLRSPALNVSYVIEYVSYLVRTRGSYDEALKLYCGSLVKGKERFYPDYYRKRLIESLVSFNVSPEQAHKMLQGK